MVLGGVLGGSMGQAEEVGVISWQVGVGPVEGTLTRTLFKRY